MRILLATEYPEDPTRIPGGVSAVAVNLSDTLAREAENEVHVLSRCYRNELDRTVQRGRVTVHYFTTPRPKAGTRVVREIPKIKRMVSAIRPDVVHAHLTDYVYPCLQMGLPTVWTPHGVTAHQVEGWGTWNGKARGLIYGYLERESLKMARQIIAITPFIEHAFRPRTRARFHLIENPVDDAFFTVNGDGVPGRLLFVGTVHPRKGLDVLVRALSGLRARHAELSLHVVGPVLDPGYLESIRTEIRKQGLERTVSFLGIRTGSGLVSEYEAAQVVVLPSRVDTAPTVISEAMAAMRPVVASTVGGIPWMVKEGETGFLVPPNDEDTLSRRILAVLGDPSLRRDLGRKAREDASLRFASAPVARKTLRVYEETLAERSAPGGQGEAREADEIETAAGYWDRVWAGSSHDPQVLDRELNSHRFQTLCTAIRQELGGPASLRIAEIGSGLGYNAVLMARQGARVTLVDMDEQVLRKAEAFFRNEPGPAPDLVCGDLFDLQHTLADRFDVVMSFGVAEHFLGEPRREIVRAHVRMTRPGGLIIISVPHRHAPLYRLQKGVITLLRRWPAGYRYFSRSGTHRSAPEYPFSRGEMRECIEGLPLRDCTLTAVAFLEPVEDFLKIFRYAMEKLHAGSLADPFRLPDIPLPLLDRLMGKHLLLIARKQEA